METGGNRGKVASIEGRQFAYQAGRIYAGPSAALIVTVVLYLISGIVFQFDRRVVLVILSSLLSLPILFLYPLLTPRDGARPTRSLLGGMVALGSFVAYGLGCYLTFYEGIWGLARLFWGFAFSGLMWSVVNLLIGFTPVNGMYRLTELCRAVDEGRIIVRRSA